MKLISFQGTSRTRTLKACRGINNFKRRYQPRRKLIKDDNGYLLADSHNV
jgi:hypothetical protein